MWGRQGDCPREPLLMGRAIERTMRCSITTQSDESYSIDCLNTKGRQREIPWTNKHPGRVFSLSIGPIFVIAIAFDLIIKSGAS